MTPVHISDIALRAIARRYGITVDGRTHISKRACDNTRATSTDLMVAPELHDPLKPLPQPPTCTVCNVLYQQVTKGRAGKHK